MKDILPFVLSSLLESFSWIYKLKYWIMCVSFGQSDDLLIWNVIDSGVDIKSYS